MRPSNEDVLPAGGLGIRSNLEMMEIWRVRMVDPVVNLPIQSQLKHSRYLHSVCVSSVYVIDISDVLSDRECPKLSWLSQDAGATPFVLF
jgi:hypothetical protein